MKDNVFVKIAEGKKQRKDEYDAWTLYDVQRNGVSIGLNILTEYYCVDNKIRLEYEDEHDKGIFACGFFTDLLDCYGDHEVEHMLKNGFNAVCISQVEETTPDFCYIHDNVKPEKLHSYVKNKLKNWHFKYAVINDGNVMTDEEYYSSTKKGVNKI